MGQFKNAGQTVHLGVSPMLSVLLFPRLLARFQRAFPAAKLELTEGGSQANIARVEEAAGVPLALLGEDSFLTNYMEEQFKIRGAKLNAVLYTNQLAAVGQIVREGTAAAFLFEGVLPPEPEVAVIPVEDLPAARVCLVWKEGRKLSPCAGQFIRMVKEAGGDWGPGLSTPVL